MPYQIVGVEIIASYDAMTKQPADLRPFPTLVSSMLTEKLSEAIKMPEVVFEAVNSEPIDDQLTSALFIARGRVVALMNANIVDTDISAVELDSGSPQYIPTSTGGHNTIGWLRVTTCAAPSSFWDFDLNVQGEAIHAYACLLIMLQSVEAPSSTF